MDKCEIAKYFVFTKVGFCAKETFFWRYAIIMPYLSTFRQLENTWTTNLAWRLGNLLMHRGLKLINDIFIYKYYMFEEIF
jgi:hypothetical protein